jgi:hypothetical protein
MPLLLEIPESAVPAAKTSFTIAAKDTLARLNTAIKEWESMQPLLKQLDIYIGKPNFPLTAQSSFLSAEDEADLYLEKYDPNKTWVEKARYVIGRAGKPLTAKDIVEELVKKYEPRIDRVRALNSMPASLSVAAREGRVKRDMLANGEYEYMI